MKVIEEEFTDYGEFLIAKQALDLDLGNEGLDLDLNLNRLWPWASHVNCFLLVFYL